VKHAISFLGFYSYKPCLEGISIRKENGGKLKSLARLVIVLQRKNIVPQISRAHG